MKNKSDLEDAFDKVVRSLQEKGLSNLNSKTRAEMEVSLQKEKAEFIDRSYELFLSLQKAGESPRNY